MDEDSVALVKDRLTISEIVEVHSLYVLHVAAAT